MAAKKLTVVVSQAPGKNPVKRHLEEEIATALLFDSDVDVSLVPNLYDMSADHTGLLFLRSVRSDLIVLSWMYPRAAHWILDRQQVKGRIGTSLLHAEGGDDDQNEEFQEGAEVAEAADVSKAIGAAEVPNRNVYCIDLREHSSPKVYLEEIRRIASESAVQTFDLMHWINGSPQKEQIDRYLHADRLLEAGRGDKSPSEGVAASTGPEPARQRWYPVIDYARCTNCMECIDFCLFGVYGVDQQERILVEEQDNCKRGCPACSRVCPENAIIFPGHKTPAIAGAEGEVAGLKIDLSRLFGAPSALEIAAQERDVELVAEGRTAVGMTIGIPKRQTNVEPSRRDELDDLIDGLDALKI
jgi:hypothetical protein